MQITVNRDGQHYGPYPVEDAAAHLASGGLLPTDWAWTDGMADWAPLSDVVASLQAPTPPAPQPAPVASAAPQPKEDQYATVQADSVHPVAAQPMAAQPMTAPSQLSSRAAGVAVAQPKPKEEAKPRPQPAGEGIGSKLKNLFAGNTKMIVVGVLVIAGLGVGVFGAMEYMGKAEVINIEVEKVNEPAVSASQQELQKFGAQLNFDANEQVNTVVISGKPVTAKELGWVFEFKALTKVTFMKCEIDDASLEGLKGLSRLSFLDISENPKITDAAIGTLKEIKALTTLTAVGTGITDAGVLKLKEALPDCIVTIKLEGGGNPGGGPPGAGF